MACADTEKVYMPLNHHRSLIPRRRGGLVDGEDFLMDIFVPVPIRKIERAHACPDVHIGAPFGIRRTCE